MCLYSISTLLVMSGIKSFGLVYGSCWWYNTSGLGLYNKIHTCNNDCTKQQWKINRQLKAGGGGAILQEHYAYQFVKKTLIAAEKTTTTKFFWDPAVGKKMVRYGIPKLERQNDQIFFHIFPTDHRSLSIQHKFEPVHIILICLVENSKTCNVSDCSY